MEVMITRLPPRCNTQLTTSSANDLSPAARNGADAYAHNSVLAWTARRYPLAGSVLESDITGNTV